MSLALGAYRAAYAHPFTRRLLEASGLHYVLGTLRVRSKWIGPAQAFTFSLLAWMGVQRPTRVRPPGWVQPVFLRPASTDLDVFGELVEGVYRLDPPPVPCAFIVDAGANIGIASLLFARDYPDATIVAIEPSPENMAMLQRNSAGNPRIHAKPYGLWPSSGPLRLVDKQSEAWAFQVQACDAAEADFEGITIPELLAEFNQTRIDILKIDIEGSEWPLLFDAPADWLEHVNALLIEFHPGGDVDLVPRASKLIASHGLHPTRQSEGVYIFRR